MQVVPVTVGYYHAFDGFGVDVEGSRVLLDARLRRDGFEVRMHAPD